MVTFQVVHKAWLLLISQSYLVAHLRVVHMVEALQVVLIAWLLLFFQAHKAALLIAHMGMVHLVEAHLEEAHLGVVHLGVVHLEAAHQEAQTGVKGKDLQTHLWTLLNNVNLLDREESWESRITALEHFN